MALALYDRVQQTGTANTTVSFTLSGSVTGYQSFSVVGNGNTTYYGATDTSGNWEVGIGTYSTTGPTLTRTTILASSNSGSAVTFSGTVTIFVTYPSERSVNLDASSNVSALGTISSGTWNGSTIGVAYGGTGVTSSSGANSVMLRDANQNVSINRLNQSSTTTTAAGTTTTLTAASTFSQILNGTGGQTFKLPDATTLTNTTTFEFNNNATGTLTIVDNASGAVGTVTSGGAAAIALLSNSTIAGTWDVHAYIPENVTWGTNALALSTTVITGGTWNGGTIPTGYGGTGLTTFTGANNALYSTSASALAAGTLPTAAGGTGVTTTPTNGQLLIGNGTNYSVASLGTGTGISTTTGSGTLTINNTGVTSAVAGTGISVSGATGAVTITNSGVTSLAGTSPVNASASTGSVTMSLASAYGDTQNPYGTKTANYVLAGPTTGAAAAPTFRALVAADIPSLSYVTSVTGTSPVSSSGGTTPAISLASGYGDTQNPYASKTANYFLAAPNGSAGAPTFRAVVAADIPTLNQNTTGTASNVTGTVVVANGGTGSTTLTANNVLLGNGTSPLQVVAPGTSGNVLTSNGTTWASTAPASPAAAGSNTQVQYNNSGSLGASSNFTYTSGTGALRALEFEASNGLVVNNLTVGTSYSIPSGYSASSVGPVTVSSGVSVTVPSGSRWVVL